MKKPEDLSMYSPEARLAIMRADKTIAAYDGFAGLCAIIIVLAFLYLGFRAIKDKNEPPAKAAIQRQVAPNE